MDIEQLKIDYRKYNKLYLEFQNEIEKLLNDFKKDKKNVFDIHSVEPRPNNDIKQIDSIIGHVKNNTAKYKKYKKLIDIKDIAGARITCHCNSDRERIFDFIEGELKQRYEDVIGDKKDGHYRAYHLNFAKIVNYEGNNIKIYCEVQIRTVLGNAWAIQDTRYVYKNKESEGESRILSKAISDILNSCENLWEIVKNKSATEDDKNLLLKSEKTQEYLDEIKSQIVVDKISLGEWFNQNSIKAIEGINNLGISTYMEVKSYFSDNEPNFSKKVILEAARNSQIKTFGWPIGVFLDKEEYKPKPNSSGIYAEISIKEKDWIDYNKKRITYDYWAINRNGSFYLLKSLFEDQRKPGYIFFNTRIIRIAETLMYLSNLYKNVGINVDREFSILIKHSGLKGKTITAVGNRFIHERKSFEDESAVEVKTTIKQIEESIAKLVKEFVTPLFEIFDFFHINDEIIEDIVEKYKNGNVT